MATANELEAQLGSASSHATWGQMYTVFIYLRDEGGQCRSQSQRRRRGRKCQQKSYKFVIYTWLRFLPAVRCLLPAHACRSAICSLGFKQKP